MVIAIHQSIFLRVKTYLAINLILALGVLFTNMQMLLKRTPIYFSSWEPGVEGWDGNRSRQRTCCSGPESWAEPNWLGCGVAMLVASMVEASRPEAGKPWVRWQGNKLGQGCSQSTAVYWVHLGQFILLWFNISGPNTLEAGTQGQLRGKWQLKEKEHTSWQRNDYGMRYSWGDTRWL